MQALTPDGFRRILLLVRSLEDQGLFNEEEVLDLLGRYGHVLSYDEVNTLMKISDKKLAGFYAEPIQHLRIHTQRLALALRACRNPWAREFDCGQSRPNGQKDLIMNLIRHVAQHGRMHSTVVELSWGNFRKLLAKKFTYTKYISLVDPMPRLFQDLEIVCAVLRKFGRVLSFGELEKVMLGVSTQWVDRKGRASHPDLEDALLQSGNPYFMAFTTRFWSGTTEELRARLAGDRDIMTKLPFGVLHGENTATALFQALPEMIWCLRGGAAACWGWETFGSRVSIACTNVDSAALLHLATYWLHRHHLIKDVDTVLGNDEYTASISHLRALSDLMATGVSREVLKNVVECLCQNQYAVHQLIDMSFQYEALKGDMRIPSNLAVTILDNLIVSFHMASRFVSICSHTTITRNAAPCTDALKVPVHDAARAKDAKQRFPVMWADKMQTLTTALQTSTKDISQKFRMPSTRLNTHSDRAIVTSPGGGKEGFLFEYTSLERFAGGHLPAMHAIYPHRSVADVTDKYFFMPAAMFLNGILRQTLPPLSRGNLGLDDELWWYNLLKCNPALRPAIYDLADLVDPSSRGHFSPGWYLLTRTLTNLCDDRNAIIEAALCKERDGLLETWAQFQSIYTGLHMRFEIFRVRTPADIPGVVVRHLRLRLATNLQYDIRSETVHHVLTQLAKQAYTCAEQRHLRLHSAIVLGAVNAMLICKGVDPQWDVEGIPTHLGCLFPGQAIPRYTAKGTQETCAKLMSVVRGYGTPWETYESKDLDPPPRYAFILYLFMTRCHDVDFMTKFWQRVLLHIYRPTENRLYLPWVRVDAAAASRLIGEEPTVGQKRARAQSASPFNFLRPRAAVRRADSAGADRFRARRQVRGAAPSRRRHPRRALAGRSPSPPSPSLRRRRPSGWRRVASRAAQSSG